MLGIIFCDSSDTSRCLNRGRGVVARALIGQTLSLLSQWADKLNDVVPQMESSATIILFLCSTAIS